MAVALPRRLLPALARVSDVRRSYPSDHVFTVVLGALVLVGVRTSFRGVSQPFGDGAVRLSSRACGFAIASRVRDAVARGTEGASIERLRVVENNLLVLVLGAGAVGLVAPALGRALSGAVTPLLGLLMLAVSLTFDVATLRTVLRRPGLQLLATVLVYVPMSLVALALATVVFGSGPLWLGVILLGTLPTDVSSPLLVWIGRGNVALATVFNAVNTALAPVLVPLLFLAYTGVDLDVPVGTLMVELTLTVLLPTVAGVAIRTWQPRRIERIEPVLSATGSLSYLALLLAVIGPNADAIIAAPATMLLLATVGLGLNLAGYALAAATRPLVRARRDRVAMLFTVSKKEFSIAALVVFSSGLAADVALPAAIYAIVQMITSPVVANRAARRATDSP
jgi:bile acid:Na+ symporter, BASS family